jgi:hypothetical protein
MGQVYREAGVSPIRVNIHESVPYRKETHSVLGRSWISLKVILPLLKQKALAKDMTLPFAKSLEGLYIRAHV